MLTLSDLELAPSDLSPIKLMSRVSPLRPPSNKISVGSLTKIIDLGLAPLHTIRVRVRARAGARARARVRVRDQLRRSTV